MAKYTITIKSLIDNNFNFQMNKYPIFDENYRDTLNEKILHHYYMDEIGFETAPLFRFYLNQKLNEIMPFYNTLYQKQTQLLINIENNVNLTETFERENNTTTSTSSTSNSTNEGSQNSKNLFQNTPQGKITQGDINNQEWATNVTFDNNITNNEIEDVTNSTGDADSIENYIKTIIGNNGGNYNLDILNKLKNNLLNIDLMIINELQDLFMQLY